MMAGGRCGTRTRTRMNHHRTVLVALSALLALSSSAAADWVEHGEDLAPVSIASSVPAIDANDDSVREEEHRRDHSFLY
jgi:hypothetical protein